MSGPVSRPAIVGALLKKELRAYSRDTIWLLLTLLALVAIPIAFLFLPDSVDESLTLGVAPPIGTMVGDARETFREMGATDEQLAQLDEVDFSEEQEGLLLVEFETEEDLQRVVAGELEAWRAESGELVLRDREAGDEKPDDAEEVNVGIGIAFPADFIPAVAAGQQGVAVTVYSYADVPEEIQGAIESFVREAGYQLAGQELPVTTPEEEFVILGEDRAGDQVTLQDKFRPLVIFMVLLMETFSMASLVSTEVLQRTVTAVLVTPARLGDFLFAKTVFGTFMSLGQALFVLLIIGGLTAQNWSLVLTILLMGSIMFTGIALFVGASGKDFMGQLFYTMLLTVPLLIPTFSVLFPGTAAGWVRVLPTYPIIDTLYAAMTYGTTWAESARELAYAAVWLILLYGAGLFTLRRKVASL
jgi:ABC-2 type transport system permease protein